MAHRQLTALRSSIDSGLEAFNNNQKECSFVHLLVMKLNELIIQTRYKYFNELFTRNLIVYRLVFLTFRDNVKQQNIQKK